MSKQKRPPHRTRADPRSEGPESRVEAGTAMSNAALQQSVEGMGPAALEVESAKVEALAAVERGVFAAYTEPRATERIDRFVHVIAGSRLPADRKTALVDKLVGDQETAKAIESTLERLFGGEGIDARTAALEALEGAWTGLQSSDNASGGQGTVGERAERLMVELAATTEQGEAVRDFCREVYLIVGFNEEEEEEEELDEPLEVE